jgi:hypothetical protein
VALLSDLPTGSCDGETCDDLLDRPEGVQIGAQPTRRQETHIWVANVAADVAHLFRARLCSVAR